MGAEDLTPFIDLVREVGRWSLRPTSATAAASGRYPLHVLREDGASDQAFAHYSPLCCFEGHETQVVLSDGTRVSAAWADIYEISSDGSVIRHAESSGHVQPAVGTPKPPDFSEPAAWMVFSPPMMIVPTRVRPGKTFGGAFVRRGYANGADGGGGEYEGRVEACELESVCGRKMDVVHIAVLVHRQGKVDSADQQLRYVWAPSLRLFVSRSACTTHWLFGRPSTSLELTQELRSLMPA